jgi:hypothetical protein
MAFYAIIGSLHVERLLAVVALSAEVSLGDLAHVHLVRTLGHLEDLVMAARAFDALALDMGVMAEVHRTGILGREFDIPAADLLRHHRQRQSQTYDKKQENEYLFHQFCTSPGKDGSMRAIITY